MNDIPKFSIIIPVYNVETYLRQCIESVLQQRYNDYEILLVNDGSTDNSGAICNEYKNNKNIKVFHKENGGLSSARNYGINKAIGDYIIFLDSDDFWDDKFFLSNVDLKIQKYVPDIIISGYKKLYGNKLVEKYFPKCNEDKIYNIEEVSEKGDFIICAVDKIVKRDLIIQHNIDFRERVISEDMEWCAKLYIYANKCIIMDTAQYIYRQREKSITHSVSEKTVNDVMDNFEKCVNLKVYCDEDKKHSYDKFLAKGLSMFIISFSSLDGLPQEKYHLFIKKHIHYLKNNTRLREIIIYLSLKIIGLSLTKQILRFLSSRINK